MSSVSKRLRSTWKQVNRLTKQEAMEFKASARCLSKRSMEII